MPLSLNMAAITPEASKACSTAQLPATNGDTATSRSIWDFISEDQWPILVTLLLDDDVEKLKRFAASGVDWEGFLLSSDTEGRKRECPPQFSSYSSEIRICRDLMRHPYPTNPFHMAVMYDARQCCQLIRASLAGLNLADIVEDTFTIYHAIFAGLDVIRATNHSKDEDGTRASCKAYLEYYVGGFITNEEVSRMSEARNCYHMRPIEWGIYLGYADWVDQLLYRSQSSVVQCEVSGLMEHLQLDFSSGVATDPSRFVGVLSVMADVYGESRVSELGVFRQPLVLAPLIDAFYRRHTPEMMLLCVLTLLNGVLLLSSINADYRNYMVVICTTSQADVPGLPVFFLSTRCASLALWTALMSATWLGRLRKNRYRTSVGYPARPRQADSDSVVWMIPNCTVVVTDMLLIVLLCAPGFLCGVLGAASYRPLAGTLILVQLIALMCSLTTAARLLPLVSKFINSFYRSFAMFAHFLVIYVLMLIAFTRLFSVAYRTAPSAANDSSTVLLQPEGDQFLAATYRTFLITLNVFDTRLFQPSMANTDIMFTHMAFILLIPVMFINFVVGVLSSVVGTTMAYDIDCRYLLELSFSEYCEATFFWLYRLLELIAGPRRLVLSICRPLTKLSRCISHLRDKEF